MKKVLVLWLCLFAAGMAARSEARDEGNLELTLAPGSTSSSI